MKKVAIFKGNDEAMQAVRTSAEYINSVTRKGALTFEARKGTVAVVGNIQHIMGMVARLVMNEHRYDLHSINDVA